MSTDLEFHLPIIKTNNINSSQNSDIPHHDSEISSSDEDCHTPKSPESMIPAVLSCPPPPRKPQVLRRRQPSCKRKLCELQFFEIVAREEIESLFKRVEENINGANKRSGSCVM